MLGGHEDGNELTTGQPHDHARLLDEKIALRSFLDDGVTRHEIEQGRLRGALFKPKGEGPSEVFVFVFFIIL